MRHYTFLLLAVIAVALIAFAVWRLNRGPAGEAPEAGPGAGPGAGPDPGDNPWPGGGREEPVATGIPPEGTDTVANSERSTSWNG
jgi:hypothetical protein